MSEGRHVLDDVLDTQESDGRAEKKRSRRALWVTLGILGGLLLIVLAIAGYYFKSVSDALDNIQRDDTLMPSGERPAPVEGPNAPLNIVLMGSDTRGDERGRSDVLQLLHLNGARDEAYLMSIPRDSWVEIPGRSKAKINAAYSWGGAALTVETMENLLGVPMDHTVIIDFEGFVEVIDELGGVTVNNQQASSNDGFDFPQGEITLDGESALVFVRERKTLANGDFGRAERQRDVIKAVVSELATTGTLADPVRFSDIVTTIGSNFVVDSGLTNQKIIELATGSRISPSSINSFQMPIAGTGWSDDNQSIVLVDWAKVDELKTALRQDKMAEFYTSLNG